MITVGAGSPEGIGDGATGTGCLRSQEQAARRSRVGSMRRVSMRADYTNSEDPSRLPLASIPF